MSRYNNRDNKIKRIKDNEQTWEELDVIYNSIARGIVDVGSEIQNTLNVIKILTEEEAKELILTVNSVTKDLTYFSDNLIEIRNQHKDFKGNIKNADDLALCLTAYNEYVVLNDKFTSIIYPAMLTITEIISKYNITNLENVKVENE